MRILVQRQVFENKQEVSVTINGDRYLAMLHEFWFTKIEEDIGNIRFQQDGVACHTAGAILEILRPVFEDRIISRRGDIVLSHRSCDITRWNYLCGAVKDNCYADKSETRQSSILVKPLVKCSCTQ